MRRGRFVCIFKRYHAFIAGLKMLFRLLIKNLTFAINVYHIYAGVAELADAPDLGSGAFGFVGSNPSIRTAIFSMIVKIILFWIFNVKVLLLGRYELA